MKPALFQRRHFVYIADCLRELQTDNHIIDEWIRFLKCTNDNFNVEKFKERSGYYEAIDRRIRLANWATKKVNQ